MNSAATISLILDTNVVLDWLVFKDAFMRPLRDGLYEQRIVLLTHQPAVDELQRVLNYKQFKLDVATQANTLREYRASTSIAALPENFSLNSLLLPAGFPRCRDRDDRHFLALAYHAKANALVSRDKAVLALSKRAVKFGFKIFDVPQLIAMLS